MSYSSEKFVTFLFFYRNKYAKPNGRDIKTFDADDDQHWAQLLDKPEVVNDEGKNFASAICGAVFFSDATERIKTNIDVVNCLILDVDDSDGTQTVPSEDELRAALEGTRAIVYSSPSHTAAAPRWRVVLPLASPLPPKMHRGLVQWLSANMVVGHKHCINVAATGDPGRLGFITCTKNPKDYVWFSSQGAKFDWTAVPETLTEETWIQGELSTLERNDIWTTREAGLKAALRHYATTGSGMGPGSGRSVLLWQIAAFLWWEWAAEDTEFVMTVLRQINNNFAVPENEDELLRQCGEAEQRTVSERRQPQYAAHRGSRREPAHAITQEQVKNLGKRLKQRRNMEFVALGDALIALSKGTGSLSTDEKTWRGLVTKCAQELAKQFPNETAERITHMFEGSLGAMKRLDPNIQTTDEVLGIVQAKLESVRRLKEQQDRENDAQEKATIEFVTGGARNSRYTEQEVHAWHSNVGLRPVSWILVVRRSYYVFVNGTWVGPYTKEEFGAQAYKDLLAAGDVGVKIQSFSETSGKWVRTPVDDLTHIYGSKAEARIDLNCDRTYFDSKEKTLIMSGPPKTQLEPKFHDEVDQWLRIMTGRDVDNASYNEDTKKWTWGDNVPVKLTQRLLEAAISKEPDDRNDDFDVVCDWMACLTQLDMPCAALYLQGMRSTGKGLFAEGVANIWKTGAIDINTAFNNFNALLADTPLVWVDEGLPEGMNASVLLRRALAAREFVFTRKNVDSTKVAGCLRMLFTANNLDLFNKTKEAVKKEDVDALALRFAHVHVKPEAAAYLEQIKKKLPAFVMGFQIAEHALWLVEKRFNTIKARGARFLVEGRTTDVSDVVATSNPAASECCTAICRVLANAVDGPSNGMSNGVPPWLAVRDEQVWVHAPGLRKDLSMVNTARDFTDVDITRAIGSMSFSGTHSIRSSLNKVLRMRRLDLKALNIWCQNTGVYTWGEIEIGIKALTKSEPSGSAGAGGGTEQQIVN